MSARALVSLIPVIVAVFQVKVPAARRSVRPPRLAW